MESGFVAHLARPTADQAVCARVYSLGLTTLSSRQACYIDTRPLDHRPCIINPSFFIHLDRLIADQATCHELRLTILTSWQTNKPTTNNHPLDT